MVRSTNRFCQQKSASNVQKRALCTQTSYNFERKYSYYRSKNQRKSKPPLFELIMASPLPYALEVSPEASLQFTITRDPPATEGGDGSSRCVMTLSHPGLTNQHLAFKVRPMIVVWLRSRLILVDELEERQLIWPSKSLFLYH